LSSDKNLGAPALKCSAPSAAYRQPDVFHMGTQDWPHNEPDYRSYKFLGRLKGADFAHTTAAQRAAKEKFGQRAKVFRTAKWWVAYELV
jgi:hypothetical protein